MTEETLFERIDEVLKPLGSRADEGEEFRSPPLDVLRDQSRGVRLHWAPFFGRGLSVVSVVRQPVDLPFTTDGCKTLLKRLAMAVNGRYPPTFSRGASLGLTAVVLTPEPIGPGDEAVLKAVINGRPLPRLRAVPLGMIRVNLGQEAVAFALAAGPEGVFPEPLALADALCGSLRRFVPLMEW